MNTEDLERRISDLRSRPLVLLCRTPRGREKAMTVQECRKSCSRYIHVLVPNELDELLARELGGET